jgi:hypothetical protein
MNTKPDDDDARDAAAFRRAQRRFQWFVWPAASIGIALPWILPLAPGLRSAMPAIVLGYMVIVIGGVILFAWWLVPRSPLVTQLRPAGRRYTLRFLPAMLLYVFVFAAATWVFKHLHPTGAGAVLMALAPSVPILLAIRAMMLFLKEETDEFLRSRMLEGWAIATILTLSICTVWGFLDQFAVVPHLPLWAAFPLWACCLMPASFILQRRDA